VITGAGQKNIMHIMLYSFCPFILAWVFVLCVAQLIGFCFKKQCAACAWFTKTMTKKRVATPLLQLD
jgi:hypothetical protein